MTNKHETPFADKETAPVVSMTTAPEGVTGQCGYVVRDGRTYRTWRVEAMLMRGPAAYNGEQLARMLGYRGFDRMRGIERAEGLLGEAVFSQEVADTFPVVL